MSNIFIKQFENWICCYIESYYLLLSLKVTSFSKCYHIKGPQGTPSIIFYWCFRLQHIIKEKDTSFSAYVESTSSQQGGKMENNNSKHCSVHGYNSLFKNTISPHVLVKYLKLCLLQPQWIWFAPKHPPSVLLMNEQKYRDMQSVAYTE
jgi:hypothetical protein